MRFRIKYQTRGKVEPYIAMSTSFIAALGSNLVDECDRYGLLQNISEEVQSNAMLSDKGLTANPICEIDDITMSLSVFNTNGREVLLAYFERVYENEQYRQVRKF